MQTSVLPSHHLHATVYVFVYPHLVQCTSFYYYYFLFSHCYAKYWKEWIKSIDDLTRF